MNKLISLFTYSLIIMLVCFTSPAYAEYYVVRSVPRTVVVCNTCQTPHKVYRTCAKKHHVKHHRYIYHKPYKRNTYSINVYYPVAPSACCGQWSTPCNSCRSCSLCNACQAGLCGAADYGYQTEYVETIRTYTVYEENDFDFDRRTADDVGSDMDIDY